VKDLYVKAIIRQPTNKNQIWELKFQIKTPQNSPIWTLNGIRATSYSNWSFVTISPISNPNPITTLVTYNDVKIVKDENFEPTYNQAIWFKMYNNSAKKLEIDSFVLQIAWSFLNGLDENTRFILKEKWTSSIFSTAYLKNMNTTTWLLSFNYWWNAYNFISANSYVDYILEVEYFWWAPSGSREVRLNNVIVWDWFWWTITNLNQYSDIWIPTEVFYYRY
jgi:hypothetical protein